jgi:hypothetical protein
MRQLTGSRLNCYQCAYQSECGDQRVHERHWVVVHWWRQAGQTPPVSNVFHSFPQEQDHRSSLRGDQPQSGQRMRGSDGLWLFSSSRFTTALSATGLMPTYYDLARVGGRERNFSHRLYGAGCELGLSSRAESTPRMQPVNGDLECGTTKKFRIIRQENTKARPVPPNCIAPSPDRAAMLCNDSATYPEPDASALLSLSGKEWLE